MKVEDRLPVPIPIEPDREYLCEGYDGYVVCWFKDGKFVETYNLYEVTPIRHKLLVRSI